jgi:two-component system OmpR family sensor kinase
VRHGRRFRGFHGLHGHGVEGWAGLRLRFRLQRQLFWWAGITILLTGAVTVGVLHLVAQESPFRGGFERTALAFVGSRFEDVWERPEARRALARELSEKFRVSVTVSDAAGRELEQFGGGCSYAAPDIDVARAGQKVGQVQLCLAYGPRFRGFMLLAALFAAVFTLWAASAWFARRLARPFIDLVRVTREIGSGKLSARMRLGRHGSGEAAVLAEAINDMASRIERQIEDQRELLAAVSHELRSPLTRLRVLVELADEQGDSVETRRKIEREVIEIDALVGKLLASSRLDFETLDFQKLGARDVALRALERAGLDSSLLDAPAEGLSFDGDATLIARALGNLLENAARHAGRPERLIVSGDERRLRFEVLDRGPGFSESARTRAFDPFFRGASRETPAHDGGALGLGLSLVARIARAHGGRAFAENREGGGARVVLEVATNRAAEGRGIDSTMAGR